MEATQQLSDVGLLIQDLAQALVDCPANIEVRELISHSQTVLEVIVAGGEFGRVIGRSGHLADALRILCRNIGGACRRRLVLEFVEGSSSHLPRFSPALTGEDADLQVKGLLERLIAALVDAPQAVKVHLVTGHHAALYEVDVAPEDVPRLIGKRGMSAEAIRDLLTSMGLKNHLRHGDCGAALEPADGPMNHAYTRAQLRELFQKSGLTQEEFARRCGLTQSSIARLLAGQRRPQLETLVKVCCAFQVDLRYFIRELGDDVSRSS
jgi:hypothetical protein